MWQSFRPGILVNKVTTNPVRRLVLMLEKARKEFDSIAKEFHRSDDSALANEEMALWEDRICDAFIEFGAPDAATKLRNAKWTIIAGELEANMERRIEAKETVLVALLNDLSNHPEFWKKKLQRKNLPADAENGHPPSSVSAGEGSKISGPLGHIQ